MARTKPLVKVAVVLAVMSGLAFLFIRSVNNVRSEAYTVRAAHMAGWRVAIEPADQPTAPLVVMRAPEEFSGELFRQIFARAMESMRGQVSAAVPVVLRGEFQTALGGAMSLDQLVEAARDTGLEGSAFTPTCVGTRRVSEPGSTRQMYFVLFDAPAFVAFRQRLAAASAGRFDAGALSPIMIVSGSDTNFNRWLPLAVTADDDCVAPIVVRP